MRLFVSIFACVLMASAGMGACSGGASNSDDDDGGGGNVGGGDGGQGGTVTPQPLTIVNWNVQNLIDDRDDGAMFETQDSNWEQHVQRVANVLRSIDADIVVLQEVEHEAIMGALMTEVGGGYIFQRVIDANDPRGIDVGILSKIAPDEVISHQDDLFAKVCFVEDDCGGSEFCLPGDGVNLGQCQPDDMNQMVPRYRYSRDAPEYRFTFNGRKLALFGVHYKSKDNDDPDKRLAEAQHTRMLADAVIEEDPSVGVIILGDFNDLPGSPALRWSLGEEPNVFANTADQVPAMDRWTFNFGGTLELVDHQLTNDVMSSRLDAGSARILHGPEVDAASDHAPIIATYMVN